MMKSQNYITAFAALAVCIVAQLGPTQEKLVQSKNSLNQNEC